jgi:hypothetical protein
MPRKLFDPWGRVVNRKSAPDVTADQRQKQSGSAHPRRRSWLSWHGATDIILKTCGGLVIALWSLTAGLVHLSPHVVELRRAWAGFVHAFAVPIDVAAAESRVVPLNTQSEGLCIAPIAVDKPGADQLESEFPTGTGGGF